MLEIVLNLAFQKEPPHPPTLAQLTEREKKHNTPVHNSRHTRRFQNENAKENEEGEGEDVTSPLVLTPDPASAPPRDRNGKVPSVPSGPSVPSAGAPESATGTGTGTGTTAAASSRSTDTGDLCSGTGARTNAVVKYLESLRALARNGKFDLLAISCKDFGFKDRVLLYGFRF